MLQTSRTKQILLVCLFFLTTAYTLVSLYYQMSQSDTHQPTDITYDPLAPTYRLPKTALDGKHIPFSNHSDPRPYRSYLQYTLDYAQFQRLFDKLNSTTSSTLISRGEAHVTVITPPEYDRVLKPAGISIQEIEKIALLHRIQYARLEPVCLGRFKGALPKESDTREQYLLYSLVVADVYGDLLSIRRKVFQLYLEKGGQGGLFQPEAFWPHVTIGFDKRDIFVEDGLYKGTNYCFAPIDLY